MEFNTMTYIGNNPMDTHSFRSLISSDLSYSIPYSIVRIVQDVSAKWYTVKINRVEIQDWVIEHDGGWRFAANTTLGGFADIGCYDLREDVYNWFVLRWM